MSVIASPNEFSKLGTDKRSNAQSDTLVGEHSIGGPLSLRDSRMFLDVATLRRLLEVAEASSIKRVQIDRCVLRIRSWKDRHGHVYETWQIIGVEPKPEKHLIFDGDTK